MHYCTVSLEEEWSVPRCQISLFIFGVYERWSGVLTGSTGEGIIFQVISVYAGMFERAAAKLWWKHVNSSGLRRPRRSKARLKGE
jgi:hypothetical protein